MKPPSPHPPIPSLTLTQLYALHRADRLGSLDARWTRVQDLIMEFSRSVVARFASTLFGQTAEHYIESLYGRLLIKFVAKAWAPIKGNLDPLLLHTARNDLATSFRRCRSPTPVYYDGAEHSWQDPSSGWQDEANQDRGEDLFQALRHSMPAFRFSEYALGRDAMLAFFLTHNEHPKPAFLHVYGVHRNLRQHVYNAAVTDINRAMIELVDAA